MIPFEALYGIQPPRLALRPYQQIDVTAVDNLFQKRHKIDHILQGNLAQFKARMKLYANKHRNERESQLGDWVYLKLHRYAQQSVAKRINKKLAAKYYGPYKVIQKLGKVVNKLVLPTRAQVHSVFHVSLLKKKIGDRDTPVLTFPDHLVREKQSLIEPWGQCCFKEGMLLRGTRKIGNQLELGWRKKRNHRAREEKR
ncbi:uncharacterized protein LOC111381393 [Olea europaea var. sylvestris]|uniref:uncharacterized protein LOC111381393 n=1 Tax=Olea europaea var. sylvestris TaxID=158386 RepID=UPI000C1CE340|nr:uncharacterized protein LOC111381393 [Olea europaea var. sylvestris]